MRGEGGGGGGGFWFANLAKNKCPPTEIAKSAPPRRKFFLNVFSLTVLLPKTRKKLGFAGFLKIGAAKK